MAESIKELGLMMKEKETPMHISDTFESGNIEVIDQSDARHIRLKIKRDVGGEHMQWFHFRVNGAQDRPLRMVIENASDASYPSAWPGYHACASYDGETWFRVQSEYHPPKEGDHGGLVIEHVPEYDRVSYAYFAPYSLERHDTFIGFCQQEPGVRLEVLGQSLDGRDLDLLTFGDGDVPCWMIARQHPGESMAEWFVEGFLDRVLDAADPLAKKLLEKVKFYVVPNMNPDGSARGHLRTNACGANLNREWLKPSMERSPEVFITLEKMKETGVRFCLDVHGDEELPYNFIAGSDGVLDLPEAIVKARDTYENAMMGVNPDFQRVHGYPKSLPGQANLSMCTNQVAARFKALAMTLEQPFKDNANAEMPEEGWSPRRAKALGASQVDALYAVIDAIK